MFNKKIVERHVSVDANLPDSIHPVLKRIYASRNVKCIDDIDYSLSSLVSFEKLSSINSAVTLLQEMLKLKKRILVVADFDTDGATSCALAIRGLTAMGAKDITYIVPNRFEHGYGLSCEIVKVALEYEPDLIITVDNGISSVNGVEYARNQGVSVLITDHHLPGNELPNANVIINPQLIDDEFPSKNLAGVGVIFYILLALRSKLKEIGWFEENNIVFPNLANFLDLVALGTVADLVPLDKNNRTMVAHGLKLMRKNKSKVGITALLRQAGRQLENLTASDLGYAVAPRLNAAGRLTDMSLGIECLLTDNVEDAIKFAERLNKINLERRVIQNNMEKQALSILSEYVENVSAEVPDGICIYNSDWHQGVVGILASKIKDTFNRPVVIFAKDDEKVLKGSARSISGLHIKDVFDEIARLYPDLILAFGGHAMAAGLTIKKSRFVEFSNVFNQMVKKNISTEDMEDICLTDGELSNSDFSMSLVQAISDAGPWGQSFPEPLFLGKFKVLDRYIVGKNHLKLKLQLVNDNTTLDAIAFNKNDKDWPPNQDNIISTYRLGINDFQGHHQIQLLIEHIELH